MKVKILFVMLILCFFVISGCSTNKEQGTEKAQPVIKNQTNDLPSFVKDADFKQVDWSKMVTKIGSNGPSDILGNPNKVGYIGRELQAEKIDKWLWHFFGKSHGYFTIVAYHQETSTKAPILRTGYTTEFAAGALYGADATMLSTVLLPKPGKWALLVYIDQKIFDTLIINVTDK
ncbi:hypothetical protein [Bacillus sp. JJ722]|uniref:hypothetical protein n=1 Tax=Bacillus sp. JJ722 TaxID=3122973 RepID=UPI002FFDD4FC